MGYSPWGRKELDTTELRTTTSPINNAVVVSSAHWRDSAINIRVSILPLTPLPSSLPHDIE